MNIIKSKVLLSIILIFILVLSPISIIVQEVKAEDITGNDGTINWSFNSETGTLTFSGTGEIDRKWQDDTNITREAVKSVVIGDGVTSIGDNVFYRCSNLTNIEIPSSVTSIGNFAFFHCTNLTKIEIPGSVTSIGDFAFSACSKLTNIEVEETDSKYSSKDGILFNKNSTEIICYPEGKKETSYTIPSSVTSIGDSAFYYCPNLTNIEIPSSVTSIGDSAFIYCPNLTNIEIPSSVTSIENFAFYNCPNLTNIEIPSSVTSIGNAAFKESHNLTIYCKSDSSAKKYAESEKIPYKIDDDAPVITSLTQEGQYIKIEATDECVGLANQAYSLDGENWYENNSLAVDTSKKYTVYVKDKLGNIETKDIQIDITKPEITNITVDGNKITVTATDNESLADKAYSIDGTNYQTSNIFTVTEDGTYIIYVKDAKGNIASTLVVVESKENNNIIGNGNGDNSNKEVDQTKQDNSQSKKILPQTGEKSIIFIITVILVICIIIYRKLKKINF